MPRNSSWSGPTERISPATIASSGRGFDEVMAMLIRNATNIQLHAAGIRAQERTLRTEGAYLGSDEKRRKWRAISWQSENAE